MGKFRIEHEGRSFVVEADTPEQAMEAIFGAAPGGGGNTPAGGSQSASGETPPFTPNAPGTGVIDSLTNGLIAGWGAKATALESAVLGRTPEGGWFDYSRPWDERYDRALAAERAQNKDFAERAPVADIAGEVTGVLAGPGKVASTLTKGTRGITGAKGLAARAGVGATEGAALGTSYALGEDTDVGTGAALGAAFGGAGALAGEAIGNVAGRAMRSNRVGQAARSLEDVKADEGAFYDAFKAADVAFTPQVTQDFVRAARKTLADTGLPKNMAPQAYAMFRNLNRMASKGEGVSALTIDKTISALRRTARSGGIDGNARNAATEMANTLDNLMSMHMRNPNPANVFASGNPAAARAAQESGRAMTKTRLKVEHLDQVFRAADGYASGFENGIRLGLRSLIRRGARDKSFRRLWSDEEWDALKQAADGSNFEAIMRQFGKFGFAGARGGSNTAGGMFGMGMGASTLGSLGSMVGGPPGAAIGGLMGAGLSAGLGAAGRAVSNSGTRRNFDALRGVVSGQANVRPAGRVEEFLRRYGLGAAASRVGSATAPNLNQ